MKKIEKLSGYYQGFTDKINELVDAVNRLYATFNEPFADEKIGHPQTQEPERKEPTEEDLNNPKFNAIWNAIKKWDIQRFSGAGYAGATGTDVMTILNAIEKGPECEHEWCKHWKRERNIYGQWLWYPQGFQWENYTPDECPYCKTKRPEEKPAKKECRHGVNEHIVKCLKCENKDEFAERLEKASHKGTVDAEFFYKDLADEARKYFKEKWGVIDV